MPDETRPHVLTRILASTRQHRAAWLAGAAAFVAAVGATAYALTPGYAQTDGAAHHQAAAPTATPAVQQGPSLADALAAAQIARFIERAAAPSPTPTPTATATAVPPTPTRPAPPPPVRPAGPPPAPGAPQAPAAAPTLPPPPPPTVTPGPWGLDTSPMDAYSQALFDDTNRRRVTSGLAPLRVNGWLIGIARIRVRDMADHNYFAHQSPITGDTAFSLMDKHGVPYGWAGENLAKNNYPAAETVAVAGQALWDSPPHRENILNPNYTDMGIAFAEDATGMKYFAIIFTGPP